MKWIAPGIAQSSQTSASGLAGVHSGEALLHAAVGVDVHGRQGLDGGPLGSVEVPQPDEMVGQSAGLVAGPGVERSDELRLLDQPVLQGEQAEEEVAVDGDGGHEESPFRETAPD